MDHQKVQEMMTTGIHQMIPSGLQNLEQHAQQIANVKL